MTRRILVFTVTLLVAGTIVLMAKGAGQGQTGLLLPGSWSPVWSPTGQFIAFFANDVTQGIFLTNPDSVGRRQLTEGGSREPQWSPDGHRIAFVAGRQLHVMNPDGSDQRQLTSDHENWSPSWSPDGRWIGFISNRTGTQQLFIMAPDGSQQRSVVPRRAGIDEFSWAANSRAIVFSTQKRQSIPLQLQTTGVDGRPTLVPYNPEYYITRIHSIEVDGGTLRDLTKPGSFPTRRISLHELAVFVFIGLGDEHPGWSPDGTHIVFASTRDLAAQIYTMNPDGSSQQRLTSSGDNTKPVWSPDGRRIAFLSGNIAFWSGRGSDPETWNLCVMNADGSQQTRLTSGERTNGKLSRGSRPTWSPDGRRIAYTAADDEQKNWRIYVVNTDGSGEARPITP